MNKHQCVYQICVFHLNTLKKRKKYVRERQMKAEMRCLKGVAVDYCSVPDLKTNLVCDVVCACILHLHHNICMQEVGLYHVWNKWGVFLLEHDGYDVVAYVPLPLELNVSKKVKSVAILSHPSNCNYLFLRQHINKNLLNPFFKKQKNR